MGADNIERAREIYEKAKAFLMKGGFILRKLRTCDKALQDVIDDKEIAKLQQAKKVKSDELSYTQATVGEISQ